MDEREKKDCDDAIPTRLYQKRGPSGFPLGSNGTDGMRDIAQSSIPARFHKGAEQQILAWERIRKKGIPEP